MLDVRTVVLVEGLSDLLAVEALAARLGRNLSADGVLVTAMGGATNVLRFLEVYGPHGLDVGLAGLCDRAEIRVFLRGLERSGVGSGWTRSDMEAHGFYACDSDLEDELIRSLGVPAVEQILDRHGDLRSFRTFQQQPAQQGKSDQSRLRRFMGTRGGRKIQYAPVLVGALDLNRVPHPLRGLLDHI
jgi:hypothetical protein